MNMVNNPATSGMLIISGVRIRKLKMRKSEKGIDLKAGKKEKEGG